jgi:hypothetical protein
MPASSVTPVQLIATWPDVLSAAVTPVGAGGTACAYATPTIMNATSEKIVLFIIIKILPHCSHQFPFKLSHKENTPQRFDESLLVLKANLWGVFSLCAAGTPRGDSKNKKDGPRRIRHVKSRYRQPTRACCSSRSRRSCAAIFATLSL